MFVTLHLAVLLLQLQVKLRDVVDYVSDILAYNSATSAAGALLPAAGDAIAAQLKGGASCRDVLARLRLCDGGWWWWWLAAPAALPLGLAYACCAHVN